MPLVAAKCTKCGGNLQVDDAKDAAICPYCNTPYIVKDAIRKYNVQVTNNITAQNINIIQESEYDRLKKMAIFEENRKNYGLASADWHRLYNQYGYKITEDDYKHMKFCEDRSHADRLIDIINNNLEGQLSFAQHGWHDDGAYGFDREIEKSLDELNKIDASVFKQGEREGVLQLVSITSQEVSKIRKRQKREYYLGPIGKLINFFDK